MDTGPSKLSLYFGISKLIDIASHMTECADVLSAHISDFQRDIIPWIAKMRGEHVQALCLAAIGMDPRQSGVDILPYVRSRPTDKSHVEGLYDLGIDAFTTEQILTCVLDGVRQTAPLSADAKKTSSRPKTRSLIAKSPESDSPASAGGDNKEKLVAFVESLISHIFSCVYCLDQCMSW